MYSEQIVQKRVERVEKQLKIKLKRTPVGEVDQKRADLERILDEKGEPTRGFSQEEVTFIRDERLLSKLDFNYWYHRYATIQKDGSVGGGVGRPALWESQKLALKRLASIEMDNYDAWQRGESVDGICVVMHKARQLGACLGEGTRVLTKNLEWTPIEDIVLGDEVIGVDEDHPHVRGSGRKMRTGRVTGLYTFTVPTMKLVLSDGTEFTTTPHHRFLVHTRGGWNWVPVEDMKPGQQIRKMVDTWDSGDSTYEDGWFGGLIDGEGSLGAKSRKGADICVSQVAGAVLDRAKGYLKDNRYNFRVEVDKRGAGSSKLGDKVVYKYCVSSMSDVFKLVGVTRPARFVGVEWWEGKEPPTKVDTVKVVSVGGCGSRKVYDIQTTTHTFCAEGFVSHNTALSRLLLVHRMVNYRHVRGMAASIDDDKIMELYDRDKLCINNLPFYLQPAIGYDVKAAHLYFNRLDSRVLYQQSRQQSGLGQGRQFDIAHLTECAFWPYPNMIELDFFPTLPLGINTLCILESTANGLGGWWYDFTEDVRKGLQRRWRYIFAPWYIETKKNRAHPPAEWKPAKMTMQHARKVYETSRELVGRDVLLERDQLYWYETERAAYQRRGKLNIFLTNYCATPEESFQHTGSAQFSVEVLERIRLGTKEPKYFEFENTGTVVKQI